MVSFRLCFSRSKSEDNTHTHTHTCWCVHKSKKRTSLFEAMFFWTFLHLLCFLQFKHFIQKKYKSINKWQLFRKSFNDIHFLLIIFMELFLCLFCSYFCLVHYFIKFYLIVAVLFVYLLLLVILAKFENYQKRIH